MANKESLTNAQLKNGTIQVMIESLDTDYKWFNKVWRPAYWFDEASKEETLIEFTKNPTGWKNAKIGDLMTVWFPQRRDVRALNPLPPLLARIPSTEVVTLTNNLSSGNTPAGQNGKREKSVKATILKIWEANAPCDPELTL